jgi:hypothetical protein
MRHVTLLLAAVTVFGSVAALKADPLPTSNNAKTAASASPPSVTAGVADSTPTVVPPSSPVAAGVADAEMKGSPQEANSDPIPRAVPAVVPPRRPVAHHARLGCFSSHHRARVAKRDVRSDVAAPRTSVWLAASSEPRCSPGLCSKFVLLGVGY